MPTDSEILRRGQIAPRFRLVPLEDWRAHLRTRSNLLVTGPRDAFSAFMQLARSEMLEPIVSVAASAPLRDGARTIILTDVDTLDVAEQRRLTQWINQPRNSRAQIISLTLVSLLLAGGSGPFRRRPVLPSQHRSLEDSGRAVGGRPRDAIAALNGGWAEHGRRTNPGSIPRRHGDYRHGRSLLSRDAGMGGARSGAPGAGGAICARPQCHGQVDGNYWQAIANKSFNEQIFRQNELLIQYQELMLTLA